LPYCLDGRKISAITRSSPGITRDGGFATATIADARYAFPLGEAGDDVGLALCSALA